MRLGLSNGLTALLPLQDVFRTFDWNKIKEEIISFEALIGKIEMTPFFS